MSNPELSSLTGDAHQGKGPDRELLHRGREDCVTIMSMDRDRVSSSCFLLFLDT